MTFNKISKYLYIYLSIYLSIYSDFPRVRIEPDNPVRIEEGDTAVFVCQVSYYFSSI